MTIPALLLAGGAVAGAGMSFAGQQQANATNVRLAREQMAFQERMSNTQYQRAMADMRSAGLNPMLAYMQGGAGNVSGQTAHVDNPAAALGDVVPRIANSALDAVRLRKEMRLLDAQAEKMRQEGEAAGAQAQWTQTRNFIDQASADPAFDRGLATPLMVAWRRGLMSSALASARNAEANAAWTRADLPRVRFGASPVGIGLERVLQTIGTGADAYQKLRMPPRGGMRWPNLGRR